MTGTVAAIVEAGGAPLAIPGEHIREALRMVALTPVPPAPPWVPGVMDLRGTVVPVIDVGARLGTGPTEVTHDTPIVVVDAGGRVLGLLVDALHGLHPVVEDPEPVHTGAGDAPITGAVRAEGKLARVLDLDVLAGELGGVGEVREDGAE